MRHVATSTQQTAQQTAQGSGCCHPRRFIVAQRLAARCRANCLWAVFREVVHRRQVMRRRPDGETTQNATQSPQQSRRSDRLSGTFESGRSESHSLQGLSTLAFFARLGTWCVFPRRLWVDLL